MYENRKRLLSNSLKYDSLAKNLDTLFVEIDTRQRKLTTKMHRISF